MKNKLLFPIGLSLTFVLMIVCCQREVSVELDNNTNNGGTGSGPGSSASGWSFTHAATNSGGCIDTAYYDNSSGIKLLTIEASDTAGNSILIALIAPNGKLSPGTYTAAQGATMLFEDGQGNDYITGTSSSSFSFTITSITDTSVKGSFKATLTDGGSNSYVISNGSVNALIGKTNPCSIVPA